MKRVFNETVEQAFTRTVVRPATLEVFDAPFIVSGPDKMRRVVRGHTLPEPLLYVVIDHVVNRRVAMN